MTVPLNLYRLKLEAPGPCSCILQLTAAVWVHLKCQCHSVHQKLKPCKSYHAGGEIHCMPNSGMAGTVCLFSLCMLLVNSCCWLTHARDFCSVAGRVAVFLRMDQTAIAERTGDK